MIDLIVLESKLLLGLLMAKWASNQQLIALKYCTINSLSGVGHVQRHHICERCYCRKLWLPIPTDTPQSTPNIQYSCENTRSLALSLKAITVFAEDVV